MVQVNIVTKFEGPSSNRLGAIKFAHGRYDGDGDGDDGVRVSCHDPDPTMLARAKNGGFGKSVPDLVWLSLGIFQVTGTVSKL